MDIEEPLLLFRAQYLQCLDHDFLAWPPASLLRQQDARRFLARRLFSDKVTTKSPPRSYELRVLKTVISKIPAATNLGPGEHDSLLGLLARLSELESMPVSETPLGQQDAYITYNCIPQTSSLNSEDSWKLLTLLESRSLVSGSTYTGHQTWAGALHLAAYLLAHQSVVAGKSIVELGAGTGFLSMLCAKYLQAERVMATDGDEEVVEGLSSNLDLNDLKDERKIKARTLLWGRKLEGSWADRDSESTTAFDVILGADIIYDKEATKALVEALRALLDLRPEAKVLLSVVIRFADVFDIFKTACEQHGLSYRVVEYQMTPPLKQKSLFYSTAMPLQIIDVIQANNTKTLDSE